MIRPETVIVFVWLAWVVSWFAAAAWTDRTVQRPAAQREFLYRLLSAAGVVMLFGMYPRRLWRETVLWRAGPGVGWAMVAIAVLGFLFAWWARIFLGRLWSSTVTRKASHHIVDAGPYSVVRHPIYTGIIISTLATAAVRGTTFAFLGAGIMTVSWYIKARLEEDFLREQLGAEKYDAYARRVPMLVPFIRLFQ